jgi:uncharacterized protein (DUF362 family)
VIIKPNLVAPEPAISGATTDPEVVRAIVDLALDAGAGEVLIAEGAAAGAPFVECGYAGFSTYDELGRVRLVDLHLEPQTLGRVPRPLAYPGIFVADLLLDPAAIFVSVAKLKTHGQTAATLSLKNLFGLPAEDRYHSVLPYGRFAMHDRSVHQTIVDLNRLRRVDFAVIDGIWAMEGEGPVRGTPVQMNLVIAGRNALAVDRVAVRAMGIPHRLVRHLDYAAALAMGPWNLDEITVTGDSLAERAFLLPPLPPVVEFPRVRPSVFNPAAGGRATALLWYGQSCQRTIDVVQYHDDRPAGDVVRTLRPAAVTAPGYELVTWNGRGEDNAPVAPGRYAVHVRAAAPSGTGRATNGVGWASVVAAS